MVRQLTAAGDEMLAAFIRGQFLVMILLGVFYAVGLGLVGLDMALIIGLVAGLASIVPYLGFILGLLLATIAAAYQFQDWVHPVYVLTVFVLGQILEGSLLTPWLVGDRIGLHPVAVIFRRARWRSTVRFYWGPVGLAGGRGAHGPRAVLVGSLPGQWVLSGRCGRSDVHASGAGSCP